MVHVFDLDGTLLDSNGIWKEIDYIVITGYHRELTEEYLDFVSHAIFPEAAKFTRSYYHLDASEEEIMGAWRDLAMDAYARRLPTKPHALEYLRYCQSLGDKVFLYTTCEPSLCQAALDHHGMTDFFQEILYAQELGLEKKYASSFHAVAQRLGVSPEECVLYDDSPIVCAAARQAGWKTVGVQDPFFDALRPHLREVCGRYVQNLGDLLPKSEDGRV